MNRDCFNSLLQQDSFVKDFKEFFKTKYQDWAKSGISPQDFGLPSSWQSFNRQLNRIIAYARGTGSQARSGAKTFEKLKQYGLLHEFGDWVFMREGVKCLTERYGEMQNKPVGYFGGWAEDDKKFSYNQHRGSFLDWDMIKAKAGELYASVPVPFFVSCKGVGLQGETKVSALYVGDSP